MRDVIAMNSVLSKVKVEDNPLCNTCKGRGAWVEDSEDDQGMVERVTVVCEDCKGSGKNKGVDGDVD